MLTTAWTAGRAEALVRDTLRRCFVNTVRPTTRWKDYVAIMRAPRPHEVLVAEDKDPASAWIADRQKHGWRMMCLLRADGLHWQPLQETREEAEQDMRQRHERVEKTLKLPRTGEHRWRQPLQYMYMTVKSKCYADGKRVHVPGPPTQPHAEDLLVVQVPVLQVAPGDLPSSADLASGDFLGMCDA